ncbi:gluconokinase [Oscillatoria sp. CS-180]|uniref:gluconokinase n=1 Tax=Oscillatoria sp. CS-180 TaxID=3021720 RepID=UPI00232F4857|nr:gluconokinase [Oscillatoria sp. CS-180]MDB9529265.1 gluconokinase [Oscillatoria sp. CS-180]
MFENPYVIGVDIGTTSTKSVLFAKSGEVVHKSAVPYPLLSPTHATAEQDPKAIFSAVIKTLRDVVSRIEPAQVLCLSFSAAMHSLILMDEQHRPLTQSITWADNRSAKWSTKLKNSEQGQRIYRRTGTPIHPMSPLVKMLWLRNEHPELFEQAARFISIKEYVFYQLFEQYVVDHSIASATGLLNLQALDWDSEALEIAGVSPKQLSTLVPTTHICQTMRTSCADTIGLPADLPVVIGASDGVLANLGVGAIQPGVVATTVGTSGAVRAVVDQPKTDPDGVLFCYVLTQDHWVIGGAINNGGIALRWIRDQLADAEIDTAKLLGRDPYDMLTAIANTIRPGAEGLIFHPYLSGERSPLWDANAKASFVGLGMHHNKAHMIRAVLEGVVYNLYLVLETLQDTIGEANSIRAAGGFARSKLWRQMLADVFNREVMVPESYESSCFGAAILGLLALGEIDSLDVASDMIGTTYQHRPIAQNVQVYQRIIPIYQRLLEKLQPEYAILAQLQNELESQPLNEEVNG